MNFPWFGRAFAHFLPLWRPGLEEPLLMATGTFAFVSRASANQLDSSWTDDLTMSEAEFLLDQLEAAGFRYVEVHCTPEDCFAVKIPWESRSR
jgi:hypothetical protein